jgi:hypothetical protein
MTKKVQKASGEALTPKARAEARDSFVRAFDQQFSNWLTIAKCCVDVEREKDWELLGFESYGSWLKDAAPRSRSYLFLVTGLYKELSPDIAEKELEQIPLGSASILKQLSSKVRKESKIRLAAKGKPSELRQVLKKCAPEQHVETLEVRTLRFTESQADIFDEMLTAYSVLNENGASAEEAVEFLASGWLDQTWEDSPHSNRQRAAQLKAAV